MRMLLNSFGRVQTHVDNSGYVVFDSSTAGSHNINIGAGVYRVVLVGAGGGGAHCRYGAGHSLFNYYAQGGVAATIDVYLKVTKDSAITINLGAHGNTGNNMSGQVSVYGTDGATSSITGIPGVTLIAGPGTAGTVINGNQSNPGTMGTATISGANILRIDMNSNDHPIVSGSGGGRRSNVNYPTAATIGSGGGVTMAGNNVYIYHGGVSYCFIQKVEREQNGL